ncbi:hypothetical protein [Aeromicrobium camelliae]|nr:hypothetical protein [Aeromicrobium camelliae]
MTTTPLGPDTDPIDPTAPVDPDPEPDMDPDEPPEVPVEPSRTNTAD